MQTLVLVFPEFSREPVFRDQELRRQFVASVSCALRHYHLLVDFLGVGRGPGESQLYFAVTRPDHAVAIAQSEAQLLGFPVEVLTLAKRLPPAFHCDNPFPTDEHG